jgi:hypothetical protein
LRLFFEKIRTLLLDKNKQPVHLTSEQRYTIAQMKTDGFANKAICQTIGKDKSLLSRELRRNADARKGEYKAASPTEVCTKAGREAQKAVFYAGNPPKGGSRFERSLLPIKALVRLWRLIFSLPDPIIREKGEATKISMD